MRDNLSYVVVVVDDGAAWRVVVDIAVTIECCLAIVLVMGLTDLPYLTCWIAGHEAKAGCGCGVTVRLACIDEGDPRPSLRRRNLPRSNSLKLLLAVGESERARLGGMRDCGQPETVSADFRG